MIDIIDKNGDTYYVNPRSVVYVKPRLNKVTFQGKTLDPELWWKISLINGEQIHTKDKEAIDQLQNRMRSME